MMGLISDVMMYGYVLLRRGWQELVRLKAQGASFWAGWLVGYVAVREKRRTEGAQSRSREIRNRQRLTKP